MANDAETLQGTAETIEMHSKSYPHFAGTAKTIEFDIKTHEKTYKSL